MQHVEDSKVRIDRKSREIFSIDVRLCSLPLIRIVQSLLF